MVIYSAAGGFADASFWSVLASGLIFAAAALIVGSLFGFLFGLPRTPEKANPTATLVTNANLDQISDWLTKILVGIGLVQLNEIANGIDTLATAAAPALGGASSAHPFAVALLVYSAIDGFILGYLWTRIVVSSRLKRAAEELGVGDAAQVLSSPPPSAPPPLPPPPSSSPELGQSGPESTSASSLGRD